MRKITAYECVDGSIHEDERKAKAHEEDLLGQELDGLLRLFELDITRQEEYRALLGIMKKREELLKAVRTIVKILDYSED